MGSFDYTCGISGLPIHAGHAVRYILLTRNPYSDEASGGGCGQFDWWFPRSFPLKAKYNDYGSVEDVEGATWLWLEGLKQDLAPIGWGDNSVHDVPTYENMTWGEFLNAMQSGRVQVAQTSHAEMIGAALGDEPAPKPGIPCLGSIRECLKGFPTFATDFAEPGVQIDEVEPAVVRVRWHAFDGREAEDAKLQEISEVITAGGFAPVLTSGSGNYSHGHNELMVFPSPGVESQRGSSLDDKRPLPLATMMVREDVWQALLALPVGSHWGEDVARIEDYREAVIARYARELAEVLKPVPEDWGEAGSYLMRRARRHERHDDERYCHALCGDTVIGMVGLNTHFEMLLADTRRTISEVTEILNGVAEQLHIMGLMSHLRFMWLPSVSTGPQFGEFDKHASFHAALSKIAQERHAEDAADAAEWA